MYCYWLVKIYTIYVASRLLCWGLCQSLFRKFHWTSPGRRLHFRKRPKAGLKWVREDQLDNSLNLIKSSALCRHLGSENVSWCKPTLYNLLHFNEGFSLANHVPLLEAVILISRKLFSNCVQMIKSALLKRKAPVSIP